MAPEIYFFDFTIAFRGSKLVTLPSFIKKYYGVWILEIFAGARGNPNFSEPSFCCSSNKFNGLSSQRKYDTNFVLLSNIFYPGGCIYVPRVVQDAYNCSENYG